jgi:hypothetical protein
MEKQPNSRMCFVCGIENPILHRRRGAVHRPLPAQARASGFPRPTARGLDKHATGRANSNSFTRYRSLGMTE